MHLLESDWEGRLLIKRPPPVGFRITPTDDEGPMMHWLGGDAGSVVRCPACRSNMLTAWDLDMNDERVRDVVEWNESRFSVYVCPNCDLYQEPYWVDHRERIVVVSDRVEEVKPETEAVLPYERIRCGLTPLAAADFPTSAEYLEQIVSRAREPNIYHQIGGTPLMRGFISLCCYRCGTAMSFSGIVDYDVTNFCLRQEDDSEKGLEFGDLGYLDVFACSRCSVLGMQFSIG